MNSSTVVPAGSSRSSPLPRSLRLPPRASRISAGTSGRNVPARLCVRSRAVSALVRCTISMGDLATYDLNYSSSEESEGEPGGHGESLYDDLNSTSSEESEPEEVLASPAATAEAPAAVTEAVVTVVLDWLQCDLCSKWRVVSKATAAAATCMDVWTCEANDDPQHNTCSAAEQPEQPEQPEQSERLGAAGASPRGDGVYAVQELLDVRVCKKRRASGSGPAAGAGGRRQFLVSWRGYDRLQATWEDEANILDPRLIAQFEARRANAPGASTRGPSGYRAGQRVRARYLASTRGRFGTMWFDGSVLAVHADGSLDIAYDDGDFESAVRPEFVLPRTGPGSDVLGSALPKQSIAAPSPATASTASRSMVPAAMPSALAPAAVVPASAAPTLAGVVPPPFPSAPTTATCTCGAPTSLPSSASGGSTKGHSVAATGSSNSTRDGRARQGRGGTAATHRGSKRVGRVGRTGDAIQRGGSKVARTAAGAVDVNSRPATHRGKAATTAKGGPGSGASGGASGGESGGLSGGAGVVVGAPSRSATDPIASLLTHYRRRPSRVGEHWQASLPPLHAPLREADMLARPNADRLPDDAPQRLDGPRCPCGEPSQWWLGRWWCRRGELGCGFEREPLPAGTAHAPRCACGEVAEYRRGHWVCEARSRAYWAGPPIGSPPSSLLGCEFHETACMRPDPTLISTLEIDAELRSVAALRRVAQTKATWVADFCCVAESGDGCGLGLFAREALHKMQVVAEYGGARLPLSMLRAGEGEYALQIRGTSLFIDGNWQNSPLGPGMDERHCPRYPAIFANHSKRPNGPGPSQPDGRLPSTPSLPGLL